MTQLVSLQPNDNGLKRYVLFGLALLAILGYMYFQKDQIFNDNSVNNNGVVPVLAMSPSDPVQITIAKIGVTAPMIKLGLNENKSLQIPKKANEVGWYQNSPTPGEVGPSIVVGHLDWNGGPAVFSNLDKLLAGDQIRVNRIDGTVAIFEVKSSEPYLQEDFPTMSVYGKIQHSGLRLITCTGEFSDQKNRYSHNLVVYADLIGFE